MKTTRECLEALLNGETLVRGTDEVKYDEDCQQIDENGNLLGAHQRWYFSCPKNWSIKKKTKTIKMLAYYAKWGDGGGALHWYEESGINLAKLTADHCRVPAEDKEIEIEV